MSWIASAPSNIALIKYIGKKDLTNLPINPSLSYTLDHLTTTVQITPLKEAKKDQFQILETLDSKSLDVSSDTHLKSIKRFSNFFQFLKKKFQIPHYYLIKSRNNFPASIGAASSASSFCALTLATYQMALECSDQKDSIQSLSRFELSALSRQGSGSSCRSFFRPWALWKDQQARGISIPFPRLIHQLIIVSREKKPISSSSAHQRVMSSPFFKNRSERGQKKLDTLLSALKTKNWKKCFKICYEEYKDLHNLYESSRPPIYYQKEKSLQVIHQVKKWWKKTGDGPLITMDAGSSVHLLYRPDQQKIAQNLLNQIKQTYNVDTLSNRKPL